MSDTTVDQQTRVLGTPQDIRPNFDGGGHIAGILVFLTFWRSGCSGSPAG